MLAVLDHPEARRAHRLQQEAAVGEDVVVDDAHQGAEQRGAAAAAVVVVVVDHAKDAVPPLQHAADHEPVARLKDVQEAHHARQHDAADEDGRVERP